MPRTNGGTGPFVLNPIYLAIPGTTILATQHNTPLEDIEDTFNIPQPIAYGGTQGASAIEAMDNLFIVGADKASSASIDLDNVTGSFVNITGTTPVTSIALAEGAIRFARAVSALPLTASASLIINGSTTQAYTCEAGDQMMIVGYAAAVVRIWVQGRDKVIASQFKIADGADQTKRVDFNVTAITTATTRTLSVQDKSGSIAVIETGTLQVPGTASVIDMFETDTTKHWYFVADGSTLGIREGSLGGTTVLGFEAGGAMSTPVSLSVKSFSTTGASTGWRYQGTTAQSSWNNAGVVSHYQFYNPNGLVGSINTSGSATTFNTSSDKRLKKNFRPFDSGSLLDGIEVGIFDWANGGSGYGVLAQDLFEVFPDAVATGSEAGPGEEGFVPWGVDYSKLVPILLAEIKSLRSRLDAAGL